MGIANYAELVTHVDHNVHVVQYGADQNVAIECLTCMEILVDYDIDDNDAHTHEWSEVKHAFFTGNPYRSCNGCRQITLDLYDDDDGSLGSCGCVDYHYADCPTRQPVNAEEE